MNMPSTFNNRLAGALAPQMRVPARGLAPPAPQGLGPMPRAAAAPWPLAAKPSAAQLDAAWDRVGRRMFGDRWGGMDHAAQQADRTPEGATQVDALWDRVGRKLFGSRWGGAR